MPWTTFFPRPFFKYVGGISPVKTEAEFIGAEGYVTSFMEAP